MNETVITPVPAGATQGLRELWRFRDLVFFFAIRDIAVRYRQTLIGFAWAFVQPVSTAVLFAVVFGAFAGLPSSGRPYIVFALSGVIPWMVFSSTLTGAAMSVVSEQGIIQKVYFPKLATVCSVVGVVLVDFLIWFLTLTVLVLLVAGSLQWTIVFAPLFAVWAALVGLAAGIWFAPVNVRYRDVRYVLPFLIQVWMYASPVAYSSEIVPERWAWIFALNPVVPAIEGFRWSVLGTAPPVWGAHAATLAVVLAALWLGISFFKRMEDTFADEI